MAAEPITVTVVYHSAYGHTRQVAEHIARGADTGHSRGVLVPVAEAADRLDELHAAQALVFGCPTYLGSPSAEFKRFMELTGRFWYQQRWKDKLAAGFTNSSTPSGDKLLTLTSLAVFAAQHSMLWVPLGQLPVFVADRAQPEPNGLGSYLGLMSLSDNGSRGAHPPTELATATHFGRRMADLAYRFFSPPFISTP